MSLENFDILASASKIVAQNWSESTDFHPNPRRISLHPGSLWAIGYQLEQMEQEGREVRAYKALIDEAVKENQELFNNHLLSQDDKWGISLTQPQAHFLHKVLEEGMRHFQIEVTTFSYDTVSVNSRLDGNYAMALHFETAYQELGLQCAEFNPQS